MKEIIDAIKKYAKAYEELDKLQKRETAKIPIGDQKTGVIGEFLALKILEEEKNFKKAKLSTNPSNPGYDITAEENGNKVYIQVKTVSSYNKKQLTSRLKNPLDYLLLIKLKEDFLSGEALFINLNQNFKDKNEGKQISIKSLFSKNEHEKIQFNFNQIKKLK